MAYDPVLEDVEAQAKLRIAGPYIMAELERQLRLNSASILTEMGQSAGPSDEKLSNLAAERRMLARQIGRFRLLCDLPPAIKMA